MRDVDRDIRSGLERLTGPAGESADTDVLWADLVARRRRRRVRNGALAALPIVLVALLAAGVTSTRGSDGSRSDVAAGGEPIRETPATTAPPAPPLDPAHDGPTVVISPEGPYAPGQRVTLHGSGFEPHQHGLTIGVCGFRSEDPMSEVQGDPRFGYTPCEYPAEGFLGDLDETGSFILEGFPLPVGPFKTGIANCKDFRCGLASHPDVDAGPEFVTLFELK